MGRGAGDALGGCAGEPGMRRGAGDALGVCAVRLGMLWGAVPCTRGLGMLWGAVLCAQACSGGLCWGAKDALGPGCALGLGATRMATPP